MTTDPFHLVVLFAIITFSAAALTLLAGQHAIRRMIRVRHHRQPPEYWRMYARACDARVDHEIDNPR